MRSSIILRYFIVFSLLISPLMGFAEYGNLDSLSVQQEKKSKQDKVKDKKNETKPDTKAEVKPEITTVPKARKQTRPTVVKPVVVKPIKVIKPKIKKP